jgi:hypothetical protein
MTKIYRLLFRGEIVYIGKTKLSLKKRKNMGYGKNVQFYKECEIELIEETDDESRERFWIEHYLSIGAPLLNIKKGNGLDYERQRKEWLDKNPDYIKDWLGKNPDYYKQWYEENKEQVLLKRREYYEENKEYCKNYNKEYYEKNKDKMNDYSKKYNEENKERLKEYRRNYYKNKKSKEN